MFGQPGMNPTNNTTNPLTANFFNSNNSNNANPTPSLFGQLPQSGSLFGPSATQSPAPMGLFGSTKQNPTSTPNAPVSLFGSGNPSGTLGTGGLFTNPLFGGKNPQNKQKKQDNPTVPNPQNPLASSSGFFKTSQTGDANKQKKIQAQGLFGQPAQGSPFGLGPGVQATTGGLFANFGKKQTLSNPSEQKSEAALDEASKFISPSGNSSSFVSNSVSDKGEGVKQNLPAFGSFFQKNVPAPSTSTNAAKTEQKEIKMAEPSLFAGLNNKKVENQQPQPSLFGQQKLGQNRPFLDSSLFGKKQEPKAQVKVQKKESMFSGSLFSSPNPSLNFGFKKEENNKTFLGTTTGEKQTNGKKSPNLQKSQELKLNPITLPNPAPIEQKNQITPSIKPTITAQPGSLFGNQEQKTSLNLTGGLFDNLSKKIEAPKATEQPKQPQQPLLGNSGAPQDKGKGLGNFSFAKLQGPTSLASKREQVKVVQKNQENKSSGFLSQGLFGKKVETQSVQLGAQNKQPVSGQIKSQTLIQAPESNVDQKQRIFSYPQTSSLNEQNKTVQTSGTQVTQQKKTQTMNSRMTESVVMPNPSQNTTKSGHNTMQSQSNQPYLSTIKPREISTKQFIDYKTLKEEEKNQTFQLYLTQGKRDIIQSIKVYFSIQEKQQKDKQVEANATDKDRFYIDFTNFFIRIQKLDAANFSIYEKFVRRVMKEERYEQKIFVENVFNQQYFNQHKIYLQDYAGKYILNQKSSTQLKYLIEKILHKWNMQKINYLNFLFRHVDLMRPKEDLFSYLFKYLLTLEKPDFLSAEISVFKVVVRDYNRLISKKLIQLLGFYNKKLGKSYKLLTEDPQRFIMSILHLVEMISQSSVLDHALKVILTGINLQQVEKWNSNFYKSIRQTKSIALLPLRVIACKLKQGKLQFVPGPKDLYKFINGDEWIQWIDLYLGGSQRFFIELQAQQPAFLIQSLSTISGNLLIERLITAKKGIYKFFELLKQQNLTDYYYRLLQCCLYNEQSIKEIDEFYFKKMYFNYEYQEIIQYIINFQQNLNRPINQLNNQQTVLKTLEPKISLLAKIISIQPQKIFDLEKYLFYPDYNKNKKLKFTQGSPQNAREGHKIIHLFIDIINIVSVKWLNTKILSRVFSVLTNLLQNKRTEPLVLAAISINKPSFSFVARGQLLQETSEAMAEFLDLIISSSYLYDLIINLQTLKQQSIKMQIFYPFRYNNTEFAKLMTVQTHNSDNFSIYWIHQLFAAMSKQQFNPRILCKLMNKLYILPSSNQDDTNEAMDYEIKMYRRTDRKIPQIFQMIVSLLNNFSIWEQITKVLEFKILKEEGRYILINKCGYITQNLEQYQHLLSTLKLLRTVFALNEIMINYQQKCPNHFVIKTLASIDILNRIEISAAISNSDRSSILLALLANLQPEQPLLNDTLKNVVLETQQQEEDNSKNQTILNFIKANKQKLDFQQASNFVKSPFNRYYENQDNLTTLSLDNIVYFLRLCPDSCLEMSLLSSTQFSQQEKTQLKSDLMLKVVDTISYYLLSDEYQNMRYRILQFIFDLKFDLGRNKVNQGLADKLFSEFIRRYKKIDFNSRINNLVLVYLQKELKEGRQNFDVYVDQTVLNAASHFTLRESQLNGGVVLRDTKEIGSMLLKYHEKQYSLYNFNQIERIIEEKAIIQIGQNLYSLTTAIEILTKQISLRKYSHNLSLALNSVCKLIADNNLVLLQNDIPFQFNRLPSLDEEEWMHRLKRPRQFLRDPLELFLTQGKGIDKKNQIQMFQKNNVIEWFVQIAQKLSQKVNIFLDFILTINKSFYANNPLSYQVTRNELSNKQLFCHLSLGKTALSAVEIFGATQSDAVGVVQMIAHNIVGRIIFLHHSMKETIVINPPELKYYLQGITILTFCLEWLRGRRKGSVSAISQVVRKISKSYYAFLPVNSMGMLNNQQLKLLLSYLSMGDLVQNHIKFDIHHHIYIILQKYGALLNTGGQQGQDEIGLLAQQAFGILVICPPARGEQSVHELAVEIWSKQVNERYFFNQSRFILQLCNLYPDEMAKLKLLHRFQYIESMSSIESRYQNNERSLYSMRWIWVVQIATALAGSSTSIMAVNEAGDFFIKYKIHFYRLFEGTETKITRAFMQQLEVSLQLAIALLSKPSWVVFNKIIMEQITFILSHHMINFFVGVAQGRILPAAVSINQIVLQELKVSTIYEQADMVEESRFDRQDNIFQFQIKLKTITALKYYLVAMDKAFQSSEYVQKYFNVFLLGNNRYISSFWDTFNKNLVVLFNYTQNRMDYWLRIKRTKQIIQLLNDCYNAPYTFLQNGYLPTVIDIPQSEQQVFSNLYVLLYLVTQLSVIHYLKHKEFIHKFNTLTTAHNDSFGTRVKQHITKSIEVSKKLNSSVSNQVKIENFQKLASFIDTKTRSR